MIKINYLEKLNMALQQEECMQHIKKWKKQMTRFINPVILLAMGCFGVLVQADTVYVASFDDNIVSVIDIGNSSMIATIPVNFPGNMVANSTGTRIYVVSDGYGFDETNDNITVIDTSSNNIVATIPVGKTPLALSINPVGTRVYVPNFMSNTVSVIDTSINEVIATIAVGMSPSFVAVNPSGTLAYVTNWESTFLTSSTISVIDTSTNNVVTTITVGNSPNGIVINPTGTYIYVSNYEASLYGIGSVSVIDADTNSVVDTIAVGYLKLPRGVIMNPAGTIVYVPHVDGVNVIDTRTNSIITTLPVGSKPYGIAINPDGTRIYITNVINNTVSVIDTGTNKVVDTISVGNYPWTVAVSTDGKLFYVANRDSNNISVIDANTNDIVATISVGGSPHNVTVVDSTASSALSNLGNSKSISAIGLPANTNTSFAGGASVDKANYKTYLTASPSSSLTVKGRITVDPSDVGKQADLLYVVGFESQAPFDGGADTAYFTMDEAGNLSTLDLYNQPTVWMNQLATKPFKRNLILQQEMVMDEVVAGQLFTKPSVNYYFMGYRRQDGTLVYTSTPITINMPQM